MPIDTVDQRRGPPISVRSVRLSISKPDERRDRRKLLRYMRFTLYDAGPTFDRPDFPSSSGKRLLFDSMQFIQDSPTPPRGGRSDPDVRSRSPDRGRWPDLGDHFQRTKRSCYRPRGSALAVNRVDRGTACYFAAVWSPPFPVLLAQSRAQARCPDDERSCAKRKNASA